jgi:hypothetical protein
MGSRRLRSEEQNLEVMLTELMVRTWGFKAGEVAAATDTPYRVVPKLKVACPPDAPLAIGTVQLLECTSQPAAGDESQSLQSFESWAQRIIDIAVSAQTNAAGPYGERSTSITKQIDDEENLERDMEFTRAAEERWRRRSSTYERGP